MKKRLLVLLFSLSFFISCDKKDLGLMCTMEYVSFGVRFEDFFGRLSHSKDFWPNSNRI